MATYICLKNNLYQVRINLFFCIDIIKHSIVLHCYNSSLMNRCHFLIFVIPYFICMELDSVHPSICILYMLNIIKLRIIQLKPKSIKLFLYLMRNHNCITRKQYYHCVITRCKLQKRSWAHSLEKPGKLLTMLKASKIQK